MLHIFTSDAFPGHCNPPLSGAGSLQNRVRLCVPFPHVTEHCDHWPHLPHPPSTEIMNYVMSFTYRSCIHGANVKIMNNESVHYQYNAALTHCYLTKISSESILTKTGVVWSAVHTRWIILTYIFCTIIHVTIAPLTIKAIMTVTFKPI